MAYKRKRQYRKYGKSFKKSRKTFRKYRRAFRKYIRKSYRRTRNSETMLTQNLRPQRLKCALRYRFLAAQIVTGVAPVYYQFSLNSAWDPYFTGVGTSANMWANLSTWYSKYMTTYCKIKAKITWNAGISGQLNNWKTVRSPTATQVIAAETVDAQPMGKFRQLHSNANSVPMVQWFTDKFSLPKLMGRKLDPSIDRVGITSDPGEEWIYEIGLQSSLNHACSLDVWITYWVEFSDPQIVSYL